MELTKGQPHNAKTPQLVEKDRIIISAEYSFDTCQYDVSI